MMSLFTGLPGSGKTALVVSELSKITDRPIFVNGIPDLQLPHQSLPPVDEWTETRQDPDTLQPADYFTFPANSIVVIDEAQRIYRPRSASSKVPAYVAAFETHRHTGVDFWLITQHPNLIDSNCRRLITRHVHVHQSWRGRELIEWVGMGDPDSRHSRELGARRDYKLPSKIFDLYKSAEVHTKIKFRLPKAVYVAAVAFAALLAVIFYVYGSVSNRLDSTGSEQFSAVATNPSAGFSGSPGPSQVGDLAQAYIDSRKPRIQGLAYTAPAYDDVTKPVRAPYPAACVRWEGKGCRCFTKQGTRLHVPDLLCSTIVERGFFVDWDEGENREKALLSDRASSTFSGRNLQPSNAHLIASSGTYGGVPSIASGTQ